MKTYRLYWSPEGRMIATVEAASVKAAIRKAPLPYSKYKGEIYATILAFDYRDVTLAEYNKCRHESYTGGQTWLSCIEEFDGHLVISCSPVEIRRFFDANPTQTIRAQYVHEVRKQLWD